MIMEAEISYSKEHVGQLELEEVRKDPPLDDSEG